MKTLIRILRTVAVVSALIALTQPAGAVNYLWNVATPGNSNWNDSPSNWLPNTGNPGTADLAIFGQVGVSTSSATVNNIVSVNTTVTGLAYTNMGPSAFHVTQIPAGVTLTVSGTFTNGGLLGASTTFATTNYMTGGGTFQTTATTFHIGNNNSSGGTASATLDLSGLSYFVYNASGGTFNMGNMGSRSLGYLSLAGVSNYITAGTININVGPTSTGTSGNFNLGSGTNIINVGTLNLAFARNSTPIQFPGAAGGLRLRGVGGTDADRATLVVGRRDTGGTSPLSNTGSVLLNGHPVDIKIAGALARGGSALLRE